MKMDEAAHIPRLILIFILCVIPAIYCKDVCVKKTPCRCVFSNGTFIDLTASANDAIKSSTIYTTRGQSKAVLTTYYYQPCYDRKIIRSYPPTLNNCNDPSPLCRHTNIWNETSPDTLKKLEEYYEYIGSSGESEFAPDGSYIRYFNLPSKTTVHLVCAKGDDLLEIKDSSVPSELELVLYSRNACLQPEHSNFDVSSWNFPLMQYACRTLLNVTSSAQTTNPL